jgi:hypothetical protein
MRGGGTGPDPSAGVDFRIPRSGGGHLASCDDRSASRRGRDGICPAGSRLKSRGRLFRRIQPAQRRQCTTTSFASCLQVVVERGATTTGPWRKRYGHYTATSRSGICRSDAGWPPGCPAGCSPCTHGGLSVALRRWHGFRREPHGAHSAAAGAPIGIRVSGPACRSAADLLGISPGSPRSVPPTGTPFDLRPPVTDEHPGILGVPVDALWF